MNADDQDVVAPALQPSADAEPLDDPAFVEKCRVTVGELIASSAWALGRSLLTKEDGFGPVWRVDFTFPGTDLSPLVNRLVFWTASSGKISVEIAVGQRVQPL
jgi:hypothetical protein